MSGVDRTEEIVTHPSKRLIVLVSSLAVSLLLIAPALGSVAPAPTYIVIDLGSLGVNDSEARAINNAGQVTGIAHCPGVCAHAFLYTNGAMLDLDAGGSRS